jgi:1,2-phenylacetyl-CoA epoxidase PaaB subunit
VYDGVIKVVRSKIKAMKPEELKYNAVTITDENTGEHYTVKTLRKAKEIYEIILETEKEIYEEMIQD